MRQAGVGPSRPLHPWTVIGIIVTILFAGQAMATAPRVDLSVTTDSEVWLELASSSISQDTAECGNKQLPATISRGTGSGICFQSTSVFHPDAEIEFAYKINDGKFVLWGYAKTPLAGESVVRCQIRPNGSNWETLDSPYGTSCEFGDKSKSSYNPKPQIKVFRKPLEEITDRSRILQLLNDNCGAGQPQCTFASATQKVLSAPQSKWQMWGAAQANCISKPTEAHTISDSHSISWSDTIGAKASGKFTIAVVEATVEANYAHSITDSYTYQESHTQNIPYGRVGAFYLQPGYLEITGDFLISTREENLIIRNTTFTLPLGEDFQPEHGGPAVRKVVLHSMDIGDAGCGNSAPKLKASAKRGVAPPAGSVELPGTE